MDRISQDKKTMNSLNIARVALILIMSSHCIINMCCFFIGIIYEDGNPKKQYPPLLPASMIYVPYLYIC